MEPIRSPSVVSNTRWHALSTHVNVSYNAGHASTALADAHGVPNLSGQCTNTLHKRLLQWGVLRFSHDQVAEQVNSAKAVRLKEVFPQSRWQAESGGQGLLTLEELLRVEFIECFL